MKPAFPCFAFPLSDDDLSGLREAVLRLGFFYVQHPLFPAPRCASATGLAEQFFALPHNEKQQTSIQNSPHFRGYSEMFNARDWREQIHFGREQEAWSRHASAYAQLRGPNLWPAALPTWRKQVCELLRDLETAGRDILSAIARCLGVPPLLWMPADEEPYLLLKMIRYLPPPDGQPRSGVAPHVDFSWITLLLQDETGGLEARMPSGDWVAVPPVAGTLVVNIGEVLAAATGNEIPATPHRVVNRASSQSRISMPFFLNPALDRVIQPGLTNECPTATSGEHVHRVFREVPRAALVFGEAEWRRKGLGVWCADCVTDPAS